MSTHKKPDGSEPEEAETCETEQNKLSDEVLNHHQRVPKTCPNQGLVGSQVSMVCLLHLAAQSYDLCGTSKIVKV